MLIVVTINTKLKADIFDNSNINYYHHQITNINILASYIPIMFLISNSFCTFHIFRVQHVLNL